MWEEGEGRMDDDVLELIFIVLLMFMLILFGIFLILNFFDMHTVQQVDTKQVPCLDKGGKEFVDELCKKKITCSMFGLIGDSRCPKGTNKFGLMFK